MYYPNLEDFREKAQHGNLIPVYKTMLARHGNACVRVLQDRGE